MEKLEKLYVTAIKWRLDAKEIAEKKYNEVMSNHRKLSSFARFVVRPVKSLTDITQEEFYNLLAKKISSTVYVGTTASTEWIGLPYSCEIPASEISEANTISDWLYAAYGFQVLTFEQHLSWNEAFDLWKQDDSASDVIRFCIKSLKGELYYGYDWRTRADSMQLRCSLSKVGYDFDSLGGVPQKNKGLLITAQMLAESETEEERAAVWIAAIASELMMLPPEYGVYKAASEIRNAAWRFLQGRFKKLWLSRMTKLVPELMVNTISKTQHDMEDVMDLIVKNMKMLRKKYAIIIYDGLPADIDRDLFSTRIAETK